MSVIIETSVGDFTIDLLIKERPKCCFNFLKLCKMKYYNLCGFHKLEKDFIAQTGDPTGTGTGGQSIFGFLDDGSSEKGSKFFAREIVPKVNHTRLGTVSMVNNGEDQHGSQFFITLRENLDYLDGIHTVFGYVVEGLETLDKMNELFFSDIIITHSIIVDDPFDDPPELIKQLPTSSPEPDEDMFRRMCIAHNIEEKPPIDPKAQESKAAATILEMIGDLPSEDVKPPDNVLFVCKLNPVTKEEDLDVIFSRFGPITECEIIRDQKTGDSLQYAFIEFANVEDCEKAYFKMDNVLIDDRRIHVDFSQSVAKFKWHRKNQQSVHNDKSKAKDIHSESRSKDYKSSRDSRDAHDRHKKDRDYDRDRDQGRDRDRDRNRDYNRYHNERDRESRLRRDDHYKKDRYSHRDEKYPKKENFKRERERERSRSNHRDRDREKERERDRDTYQKDRYNDSKRDREKIRDRDRGHDRERDRRSYRH